MSCENKTGNGNLDTQEFYTATMNMIRDIRKKRMKDRADWYPEYRKSFNKMEKELEAAEEEIREYKRKEYRAREKRRIDVSRELRPKTTEVFNEQPLELGTTDWDQKVETRQLIHNSIRTPDGTVLVSRTRHDYQEHVDNNGKVYMVDGGLDYIRRTTNGDEVDLSLYVGDSHGDIRDAFMWGTYGKEGKSKFKRVKLKDLSDGHIQAILDTQKGIREAIEWVLLDEQRYRRDQPVECGETDGE